MRQLLGPAIALIAATVAFAPALSGPFDFDDGPAIVSNATIRPEATVADILRTPPLGTAASGRPLVNASFAMNGALNRAFGIAAGDGLSSAGAAAGFRATNIILHVIAALLLFALVDSVLAYGRVPGALRSRHRSIAGVATLIWLVHPLQTEAVNYVSQRTEILASLCYLATLLAGVRCLLALDGSIASRAGRWAAASTLSLLLGAGCKEIVVTAPIVLAALDVALLGGSWPALFTSSQRRRLYVALSIGAVLSLVPDLFGARAGTVGTARGISPIEYLQSQGWAIPHYVRLAVLPTNLVYDYGQAPILGPRSLIGLTALVLALAVALFLWRSERHRPTSFLVLTFFVLLAPSSSIVPINTEIAADRRMYLALACVIIAAVCAAVLISERWPSPARTSAKLVAGITVALFTAASAQRSAMYKDPLALWTDAMQRFPSNARAYDNVGAALLRADWNNAPRADSLFVRAIALDSTFLEPLRRRASIAVRAGQYRQAESFLTRMLAIAPSDSDATATLGKLYLLAARDDQAAGRFAEAGDWLTRALRLDEHDPEAWTRLAMTRAELGDRGSALDAVHRALRADPAYPPALQVRDVLERAR